MVRNFRDTPAVDTMSARPDESQQERPGDEEGPVIIVISTKDPASQNISKSLLAGHGFFESNVKGTFVHTNRRVRIVTVEKPPIFTEPGDIPSEGSSVIFASKHVSSTNRPAMTVHATGNLSRNADLGGKPEEVSHVDPPMIRRALRKLRERATQEELEIDVTMEATHHGPTSIAVPVCFVEIGSGPNEWTDPMLGSIAADAIMDAAIRTDRKTKTAVGFGGTHYAAKYTRICLEGYYQIGHIVPRHAFETGISDAVIRDTIQKTSGPFGTALVDWKGLSGGDRRRLVSILESWGCEVARC
jgi:D-aminoacyl-tRNA deacylase